MVKVSKRTIFVHPKPLPSTSDSAQLHYFWGVYLKVQDWKGEGALRFELLETSYSLEQLWQVKLYIEGCAMSFYFSMCFLFVCIATLELLQWHHIICYEFICICLLWWSTMSLFVFIIMMAIWSSDTIINQHPYW